MAWASGEKFRERVESEAATHKGGGIGPTHPTWPGSTVRILFSVQERITCCDNDYDAKQISEHIALILLRRIG
jgi:hypothetical protein